MSNPIKERLRNKETLLTALLSIPHPAIVESFAYSGVDCLELDSEHSALDNQTMEWLLLACHSAGIAPFWRSRFDDARVTIAMDLGFTNFIFPHIRTAAEADHILKACRYRPRGTRGVGPGRPIRYGLANPAEYIRRDDRDILIGFMIEDPEAVENIDEIVSVEGVELVQVGFWDLSVGYGLPIEERHPKLIAAAERVLEAGLRKGVTVAIPPVSPEDMRHWQAKGARYFEITTDLGLFARAASNCVRDFTGGASEKARPMAAAAAR